MKMGMCACAVAVAIVACCSSCMAEETPDKAAGSGIVVLTFNKGFNVGGGLSWMMPSVGNGKWETVIAVDGIGESGGTYSGGFSVGLADWNGIRFGHTVAVSDPSTSNYFYIIPISKTF